MKQELRYVYKSLKTIAALVDEPRYEEPLAAEADSPMQMMSSDSMSSVEAGRNEPKPGKSSASKKKKMLDSALAEAHDARLPSQCQNGKITF